MKKTFVVEFDYNEAESNICETFGTSPEELSGLMIKESEMGVENGLKTQTESLVYMVENNIISGGQVMALVALKLAQDKKGFIKMFLASGLGGGDIIDKLKDL